MSFGQPLWFWAFASLPLFLLLFLRGEVRRGRLIRQLVAARLQDRLAGSVSRAKRRWRFSLLLLGMSAIIVSLAQPRYGYSWEESKRRGRDVLLAVDVSKSMLATDAAPNRLSRAKLAAQDLLQQLGGDRVGLVAFAGRAFLQAPLTADFNAVLTSLSELDPEIIPRGGTNIAEAIKVAVEAFGKGESEHRALIIFTDGEELDADALKAAEEAKDSVRIFGVGIGTADGSLIPEPGRAGGEFIRDEKGNYVKTRLDESRLRKIAELSGGFYVHLLNGPAEMKQIVQQGLARMSEKEIDAKLSRKPIERYQWPLGAGLVLLVVSSLMGERRRRGPTGAPARAAAATALAVLVFAPELAHAVQSPIDLYQGGKFEEAQREWQRRSEKDPQSGALAFNLGTAAYKNKDLDTALRAFSQALGSGDEKLRPLSEYNLGNTLFQKGAAKMDVKTLEDALGHYNQTLALQPQNADAQHNKKVTEELIEKLKQQEKEKQQQQQQQQQSGKQPPQDQQKNDQQDQKSQQPQSQEQKDQQQQDAKDQNQPSPDSKDGEKQQPQTGSQQEKQDQQDGKDQQSQKGEQQKPDGQKDGQQQPPPKSGDQKGDEQKSQGQSGDGSDGQKDGSNLPQQPDRKLSGDVKANNAQPPGDQKEDGTGEAMAAGEKEPAEKQEVVDARALLESLKREEERVRLIDPRDRKRNERPLRDW